jgi:endoglucanase
VDEKRMRGDDDDMARSDGRATRLAAMAAMGFAAACGSQDLSPAMSGGLASVATGDAMAGLQEDATGSPHDGSATDAAELEAADRSSDASSRDAGGSQDASGGASGGPVLAGFPTGTNLSGAEFGTVPGVYGKDYIYPPHSDVDYFTSKGFRILRIPFLWERMQPTLGQALSTTELGRLTDLVTYATSKGAYALIDPHNYARYNGQVVGAPGSTATAADFAAFWGLLAAAFRSNPRVIFGLMNEPHDMATELWLADANAAVAAVRHANAANVVFVPGNGWTGAHGWTSTSYGTADSVVMLGVQDPLNNVVYEVHQYFDSDSSGTSSTCVSTTVGSQALMSFTAWMSKNHLHGFLGEFGVANNPTCLAALTDMLSYVDQNRDLWVGWTWWSAGPWWGNYMYSVEPENGQDAPQMGTLLQHM